jgi:hypothetical protein
LRACAARRYVANVSPALVQFLCATGEFSAELPAGELYEDSQHRNKVDRKFGSLETL